MQQQSDKVVANEVIYMIYACCRRHWQIQVENK